ncbi:MAG: hypothetical protein Marn2KO_36710 [Marinobacter nauticus]
MVMVMMMEMEMVRGEEAETMDFHQEDHQEDRMDLAARVDRVDQEGREDQVDRADQEALARRVDHKDLKPRVANKVETMACAKSRYRCRSHSAGPPMSRTG